MDLNSLLISNAQHVRFYMALDNSNIFPNSSGRFQVVFFFPLYFSLRNDMSTTFLQQILSGKLLLVVIVGAKK